MFAARGLPQASSRLNLRTKLLTTGIACASLLAILIVALLVGGSLTQPPTAAAVSSAAKGFGIPPEDAKYPGIQLPTL